MDGKGKRYQMFFTFFMSAANKLSTYARAAAELDASRSAKKGELSSPAVHPQPASLHASCLMTCLCVDLLTKLAASPVMSLGKSGDVTPMLPQLAESPTSSRDIGFVDLGCRVAADMVQTGAGGQEPRPVHHDKRCVCAERGGACRLRELH